MRRSTMTVLAAAIAALAATAVVALPAIGDSGTKGTDPSRDASDFAACLAAHGLPGAPTTAPEIKQWLAGKEQQDPSAVRAAIEACKRSGGAPGPEAAAVIACVRSHGVDAPTDPAAFKQWLGEHAGSSKAVDDALAACKIALGPPDKAPADKAKDRGKPDCGAPAEKTPPAKPDTRGDANST